MFPPYLSFAFAALTSLLSPTLAQRTCKAFPDTDSWPTQAEWDSLWSQVDGRLLTPLPPASACHAEWPDYDPAYCRVLRSQWGTSQFHANDPISSLWQNYNNYSCMPEVAAPCTWTGYPIYVVNATETAHVKAAVDFAREKNVRLNVKSSGHDFLGRSTQPYSLSIYVHHMQDLQWHDGSFTPQGCDFSIPESAITAGGGSPMAILNDFADDHRRVIVGGSSATVSVGGYLTGGGHSVLSGMYGLGADTVLQLEMVKPDGSVVVANECQNQDLFWAMRGGGGSTFGVMTSVTIQTFPPVSDARWFGSLSRRSASSNMNNVWAAIAMLHSAWARYLTPLRCTGYVTGNVWTDDISIIVYFPTARSSTEVRNAMNRVQTEVLDAGNGAVNMMGFVLFASEQMTNMTDVQGSNPEGNDAASMPAPLNGTANGEGDVAVQGEGVEASEQSFDMSGRRRRRLLARHAELTARRPSRLVRRQQDNSTDEVPIVPQFPGNGQTKLIGSWLYGFDELTHPDLAAALMSSVDSNPDCLLYQDFTAGLGVWDPPSIRGGGNAVNPGWRQAIVRPAVEIQWGPEVDYERLEARKADIKRMTESLRQLGPEMGTYVNEADVEIGDFQQAFWGVNYERLLQIKREVDPGDVFWCPSCVGSERWEDVDGMLCMKGQ